jgi:hypothetical protein
MFSNMLGIGGSTVHEDMQLIRDIETTVRTGNAPQDLGSRIAGRATALLPGLDEGSVRRLVDTLGEAAAGELGIPKHVIDRAIEELGKDKASWDHISGRFTELAGRVFVAVRDKAGREAVCDLLPRDDLGPYFRTAQEKKLTRYAITWAASQGGGSLKQVYWDDLLVKVGLKDDKNRTDPCK